MSQNGQYQQADFFNNVGGVNISDSPWRVADEQATGGQNFEYSLTGGIRKIKGKTKVNSSADSSLYTTGLSQHVTSSGTKTSIRCADRKIQNVNLSTPSFTNLTEDTTTATSNILASSNTVPCVFSQFNTATTNVLWVAGGGVSKPYGVYSTSKVTTNGADVPTGSFTATASATGGSFASTGTYSYAITLVKASTGAESNAVLDVSATISATTDKVTLNFSGLTSLDTTKYSSIKIYRSAVNGGISFTTGSLVTTIASTTASYVDTGTSTLSNQNVPRADSTILDNSVLPTGGTFSTIATWKRRLVTTQGSTVYISDINKSESWPTVNKIVVPSGGPITSVSIISFTTPTSQSIDELLVLHKERELWVITGNTYSDFSLKFIDSTGCINQPLVVNANGYLAWVDYRGIYLWDGSDKPIYCSRTIEPLFNEDDNLDKSKFNIGHGIFKRASSEVVWVLSNTINGENKFRIKMDLRLTLPQVTKEAGGRRVLDATFIPDVLSTSLYASASIVPSTDEVWVVGDSSGYLYYDFDAINDSGSAIDFRYETKYLDFGMINTTKRYHKLIIWVEDSTDADLTLDYWTKYNSGEDDKTTQTRQLSQQVGAAVWDLAFWDSAYWDNTNKSYNPIVFNLYSNNNANEGDCIKLRFIQDDANAPCTIVGYSILYTIGSLRK